MSIIRKKHQTKGKNFIRRLFTFFSIIFVFMFTGFFGVVSGVLISFGKDIPDINRKAPRPIAMTSKVFSTDGEWLTDFHAEEDRVYTQLDKIPKNLTNAIIAIEDERFYEHNGIDYQGIGRAFVKNIESGRIVEGGSTITQQLVKNRYLSSDRTYVRKIKEAVMAYQLEKKMTKKQILEGYINTVYFGNGVYGVNTATYRYFGKQLSDITIGESAMLAGLIRAPIKYSPYENFESAKKRRDRVIKHMYDLKMIKKKEAEAALKEPLKVIPKPKEEEITAPYFIEYVKQELIKKYGANVVFKGGLRIYTTLDPKKQQYAEEAISSTLNRKNDPSASLVSIEPTTGYVKALVGGRDFNTDKFNLAVQGHRQAGSAFKIFVLSAAVESGLSLNDRFVSRPYAIKFRKDAPTWNVHNYGNKYRGSIPLREATVWSDNSVFAQVIIKVGAKRVVDIAHRLGIKSDVPETPAIALGGLTTGVSALEMATAASTLANDGNLAKPIIIKKITDMNGVVIEENKPSVKRAIDANVARTVTSALMDAMAKGTGKRAVINRPAAGKTGTAQDYRDAWFVGYTPNMATAVWMGYSHAQISMRSVHGVRVAGGSFPAEMWKKYMEKATADLPPLGFNQPSADQKGKDVPVGGDKGPVKKPDTNAPQKPSDDPEVEPAPAPESQGETEEPKKQPEQPVKEPKPVPKPEPEPKPEPVPKPEPEPKPKPEPPPKPKPDPEPPQ